MKRPPRVSVIIPCYNSAGTILSTLESVFAQTFQDFEIYAVDDGSTDNTLQLLWAFAECRPRLNVISQNNSGVSMARNAGIHKARGQLVALLDADDIWEAQHLEVHVQRFSDDYELGVSFSPVRFMTADGTITRESTRPKLSGLTPADILCTNPCSTGSAMVIRRHVFVKAGVFSEALRRAEDQEWLFRAALTGWKIEGIDQILVNYRNSPSGLSSDLDAMFVSFETMLNSARSSAPKLVKAYAPLATARMLRYLARRALRLKQDRYTAAKYMWRATCRAPEIYLKEPRQSFATLVAASIPGVAYLLFPPADAALNFGELA